MTHSAADKLQPLARGARRAAARRPSWLQDLRDRAASRFAELGFPTTRDEEWRFTNLAPIATTEFRPAPRRDARRRRSSTAFLYADAPYRLVFVNGRFAPELSRRRACRPACASDRLRARSDRPGRRRRPLSRPARRRRQRAFAALNTALHARRRVRATCPTASSLEQPIHLAVRLGRRRRAVDVASARR